MKKLTRTQTMAAMLRHGRLRYGRQRDTLKYIEAVADWGDPPPRKLSRSTPVCSEAHYVKLLVAKAREAIAAGFSHDWAVEHLRFHWDWVRAASAGQRNFRCKPFEQIEEKMRRELRRSRQPRRSTKSRKKRC